MSLLSLKLSHESRSTNRHQRPLQLTLTRRRIVLVPDRYPSLVFRHTCDVREGILRQRVAAVTRERANARDVNAF